MLIAEIITGVLLPWVLLAPTIPLLLLLIKRDQTEKANLALALLCVVSILSNVFIMVASPSESNHAFLHISFLFAIVFSGLLLRYCTDQAFLRYLIIATILVFGSVYITFTGLAPGQNTSVLSAVGTGLIFIMSVLVLINQMNKVNESIALSPYFWFAGGIFLQFGLLSLLLISGIQFTELNLGSLNDFSVLYVVGYVIQFLFFATGILIRKPWTK